MARSWIRTCALCLVLALLGLPAWAASEGNARTSSLNEATAKKGESYAHLMRAMFAIRRGQYPMAREEIERAVQLVPDSADLLVEAAELLVYTGRRSDGERLARRAIELDPEHPKALRFLANMAASRALNSRRDEKALRESISLFEKLIEIEPETDFQVYTMLARLRFDAGDIDGAIEAQSEVVRARPGDNMAARSLAQYLLRADRRAEALRVVLDYVSLHPSDAELIEFAQQLARTLGAWEVVEDVISASPRLSASNDVPPGIDLLHGEALLELDRHVEATAALERAMSADPSDRATRALLARAYWLTGRRADASGIYEELARDYPGAWSFEYHLGEIRWEQGLVDRAVESFRSALSLLADREEIQPIRDEIRRKLAYLLIDAERFEEAQTVLGEAESEDNAGLIEAQAQLALATEHWMSATKLAKRLRSLEENGMASVIEGEIAVRGKRWTKATAKFEETLSLLGDRARPRIAEVYREAGRPDTGEALLREWVEAEPETADVRYAMGVYLYQLDRFDEAEQELRRAFRVNPRHAPSLNFMGYTLAERNLHLEEALELVRRALEVDEWNGAYLDSLGWVYYQMGRYEDARHPLERAARELPSDPVVLEHLGDLYIRLGEQELALGAWTRALDAGPDDPDPIRSKIDRERKSRAATRLMPDSEQPPPVREPDSAPLPR